MIAQYILLGFLCLLALVLILPAGASVRYGSFGLELKLILGPLRLTILPRKKRSKKRSRKEKKAEIRNKGKSPQKKQSTAGNSEQPKGGKLSLLKEYIPIALDLLGAIRRRLILRRLVLFVNLSGDDPCDLAMLYGKANAAIGAVIPLLEQAFRIKKRDIQVFCDFMADETEVYANLEIVACPARMLAVVLRYGWRFLRTLMKQNSEKAV